MKTTGNGFVQATWECGGEGCEQTVTARVHVATEGDPSRRFVPPPEPWIVVHVEQDGQRKKLALCPDCAARHAKEVTGVNVDLEAATWSDVSNEGEAMERYRELHLCFRCSHQPICRFNPGEQGAALLVTVQRCLAFSPSDD